METVALYLSFFMAIYLFSYSYIEGIRIANAEGKIYGGTFVFSVTCGFLFSRFAYLFI